MSKLREENAQQGRPQQDPQRDATLVARALAGDSTAFDDLVNTHQRKAVAVASRLLGDLQDGLEVSQEAFLRAYRSLGTLENPERFGPWLMRIVTNLALNFRRTRKASSALSIEDLIPGSQEPRAEVGGGRSADSPVEAASAGELRDLIEVAIAQLPEKQRAALVLFAIEEMPQKEVAEILGCSLELVKWNVFQARKTLRKKLGEYLTD